MGSGWMARVQLGSCDAQRELVLISYITAKAVIELINWTSASHNDFFCRLRKVCWNYHLAAWYPLYTNASVQNGFFFNLKLLTPFLLSMWNFLRTFEGGGGGVTAQNVFGGRLKSCKATLLHLLDIKQT